jgi:transaldolase
MDGMTIEEGTMALGSPNSTGIKSLDEKLIALGRRAARLTPPRLVPSPLLRALEATGTSHIYADTADVDELWRVVAPSADARLAEVDGNTVNQPLVRGVLDRYLTREAGQLSTARHALQDVDVTPYLYTVVCGWIGNDAVARFGAGRPWEVSLQLHMATVEHAPHLAAQLGRALRGMVPSCLVKVPFKPQAPHVFLLARDLERDGIPVNFTSTFSARQAVAAALLADVTRTNIFLGRLNQGLHAERLGEHVTLEAQRYLRRLRQAGHAKTLLIAASLRDWQSIVQLTGCDVFTVPPGVLGDFLSHATPEMLARRLETSYEDRLGTAESVLRALRPERLRRLWAVEPELVDFLLDYRASAEYRALQDGDRLRRRFEAAGFGDMFHTPTSQEREALRRSKLPDLASPLTTRLALDTLYSLLADADFEKEQALIDARLAEAADEKGAVSGRMQRIELAPDEVQLLRESLASYVVDLRRELAGSEDRETQHVLAKREEFLNDLLRRLDDARRAAA